MRYMSEEIILKEVLFLISGLDVIEATADRDTQLIKFLFATDRIRILGIGLELMRELT